MLDQTKTDEPSEGLNDGNRSASRQIHHDDQGAHALATPPGADYGTSGSLLDDVTALYEDGKTYVSSELTYQKTRAKYAGKQGGEAAAFGFAAYTLLNVALIALAVGLIISLATLVGPLAATLIIVAALIIIAGILGYMAKKKATKMSRVLSGGRA